MNLTIQTVAAVGPKLSDNPDWVSYLVLNRAGSGSVRRSGSARELGRPRDRLPVRRETAGLRNPFMARVRGTVGNMMTVNGKPLRRHRP